MKNKNFDFEMAKELSLTLENEGEVYTKEGFLAKNYARKLKSGKFNPQLAHKGVKNLIVIPRARTYQNQYGGKITDEVRNAVAKNRLRAIMRRIKGGEF
jgi:hypothetical protein